MNPRALIRQRPAVEMQSVHPFDLTPLGPPPRKLAPQPDRLQGWDSPWKHNLKAPHRVPALLELELLRDGLPSGQTFSIRGPAVTVGRYAHETGPVDIDLGSLAEHERLRVGLPHIRIGRDLDGWRVEPMTMYFPTEVHGAQMDAGGTLLNDGDTLTLGDVHFLVRHCRDSDTGLAPERPVPPCLRLKREGALTGAVIPLVGQSMSFGRACPRTGPVDCDLSELPDSERIHLGRRHARFFQEAGRWMVSPMGRAPVFINRQAPLEKPHALMTGDEVALGNVLFTFLGSALVEALTGTEG